MDVRPLILASLRRARGRYAAGEIDVDAMRELARRGNALMARRHFVRSLERGRPAHDAEALADLERLGRALARGGTVVAIDVGYHRGCVFDEVGISTWRAGSVETLTLFDETALHRHPDPAARVMRHPDQVHRPSLFGPSLPMSRTAILSAVRSAFEAADVALFHSMHADMPRLGLTHQPGRVMDTERLAWIWFGRRPSLAEVCARYGVDASGAHNSGNDARYTLDVALAMVGDATRTKLSERNALRLARDAAYRRLVLHPTRAPGREALRAAWVGARASADRYRTGSLGSALPIPLDSRLRGDGGNADGGGDPSATSPGA